MANTNSGTYFSTAGGKQSAIRFDHSCQYLQALFLQRYLKKLSTVTCMCRFISKSFMWPYFNVPILVLS